MFKPIALALALSLSVAQAAAESYTDCLINATRDIAPDHSMSARDASGAILVRCAPKVIDADVSFERAADIAAGLVVGYRFGRYGRSW